jgi:lipopolysaccharide transport system permease protein
MSRLRDYADARELTVNLTLRELRSKYKKSVLGWTWSLLNPLSTMIIFTVVFSAFLKVKPSVGHPSGLDSFAMFLLCGLLPWNFMSGGMSVGADCLIGNSNLIKKVYFPREIIVFSNVAALFVSFCVEMGVLVVALVVVGNMVLLWLPLVIIIMLIEAAMVLGIGLLLSTFNVYFRDVKHLITILSNALFYSMPIVYPLTVVPKTAHILGAAIPFRRIYLLNPLVRMVTAFRAVLYDLRFPAFADMAYLVAWAVGLCVVGLWMFHKFERRLAEEL